MIASSERIRELAAAVAMAVVVDCGIKGIPMIDRNAVALRLDAPDIVGTWNELMDLCKRVAALARTAQLSVTIPQ